MVALPVKKDGIYTALFTPYTDDDKVDLKKLVQLLRYETEHGIEGVYCCGSSGEGLLLDSEERKAIVSAVADEIGGKLPFIVHTGALSTKVAVELSNHAQKNGASAVSLIPPIYYHYTTEEIGQFYTDVASSIDLGVIVYNIPQFTGISFSKENSFLKSSKIIGIKHTSMNLYDLERIRQAFPEKIIFNGFDEIYLSSLAAGASATIGTTVNICPKLFKNIRESFAAGDIARAQKLQCVLNNLIEALVRTSVFPAAKYCLTLQGIDAGSCRKPFAPLSSRQKAQVEKAFSPIKAYL
jgi:N-acetylneuraminate lyase